MAIHGSYVEVLAFDYVDFFADVLAALFHVFDPQHAFDRAIFLFQIVGPIECSISFLAQLSPSLFLLEEIVFWQKDGFSQLYHFFGSVLIVPFPFG